MTDLAALLILTLTLLPGADLVAARDDVRALLVKHGCADVRVELHGRGRDPVQVRASCKRPGLPSPGTPEGPWRAQ